MNANVTHDEQSLIYEMTTFQGVSLTEAIQRDKLYATFIFTSLGIPMLWEGMEFSEPRGWTNDSQKLSYRPVQFSLLGTTRGQEHYAYYHSLLYQRRHNPALRNGQLRKLFRYNAEKTLVWGFEDSVSSAKVMAVANLSGATQTVTNVPWLAPGNWYDIFDQSVFPVGGASVPSISLPAYTARVYSSVPDTVLVDVPRSSDNELPTVFALDQNFPNPFNPSTTIRFQLPEGAHVVLRVYDVLGREVATLVDRGLAAGQHTVVWNGTNKNGSEVPSGVYLYKLEGGNVSLPVRKMVLMR